MSDSASLPLPNPEPLFTLDLGDNGGRLAPTNVLELTQWIQKEQQFWSWANQRNYGNHEQGFRQAFDQFNHALNNANQSQQYVASNPQQAQNSLESSKTQIQEALVRRKLPHSSTPLAKRIDAYRQDVGDQAASFLLAVHVPPDQGHQFQPNDLNAWRGLVDGLVDRFQPAPSAAKGKKQAADQSFEQLRVKAEELVADKTEKYDALHRSYAQLADGVQAASTAQSTQFADAQDERAKAFEALLNEHKSGMEALRKLYREEMGLKAPAEYWETKRAGHTRLTWITGSLSFAGIAGAALGLGWQIHDLLVATPKGSAPESWRIAVLVLIGLFAVWGVRLVVRMFLSNMHLMTDAAERVVMVKTYLSLLEGDRLSSAEDRQLILQALFRPASDGIVKDEAIPASFFELLTRNPKP